MKFSNNHQNRDNFPQVDKIGSSQDPITDPPAKITPNPSQSDLPSDQENKPSLPNNPAPKFSEKDRQNPVSPPETCPESRAKLDLAAKTMSSPKTKSAAKTDAKSRSTSASRKKPKSKSKVRSDVNRVSKVKPEPSLESKSNPSAQSGHTSEIITKPNPLVNKSQENQGKGTKNSLKSTENTKNIDLNRDKSVSIHKKQSEKSQNAQTQLQKTTDIPKKITIVPLESVDFPGKSISSGTRAATIDQQSESGSSVDPSLPPAVAQPRSLIMPDSPGYLPSIKRADAARAADAVKPPPQPSLRLISPDISPAPKQPVQSEPAQEDRPAVAVHPDSQPKLALRIRAFRPSIPLMIILVLAVAGILATLMVVRPGAHVSTEPLPDSSGIFGVAVLDITNDTGDRLQDAWIQALGMALATDLSHAESFRVIPDEQVILALQELNMLERKGEYSLQNLQDISRKTGAFYFVQGRVLSQAGTPSVILEIKEASKGRSLFSRQFDSVDQDNFLNRIDELSKYIRENLPLSEKDQTLATDRAFLDAVTTIPLAYELYTQGKRQFWLHNFRKSIDAFEKAIAYDPEFAPAYLGAADAYDALGYFYTAWKKAQTAQSLVNRLTELELLQLQAEFYRRSEKTFDIAQKVYIRILELDPTDAYALCRLGNLYSQLGEWDKARACFEQSKQGLRLSPTPHLRLSLLDAKLQDYSGALNRLSSFARNNHGNEDVLYQMAVILLLQGKYDQALEEVKRGQKIYPDFKFLRLKGELLLLKGDVKAAENEFNKLLQDPEPLGRLWGRKRLADLLMLGGRFSSARSQFSAALDLAEVQQAMAWKYRLHLDLARNYLESGNPAKAMTESDAAWGIAVQGETMDLPREALHVRGLCYLALNRLRDAQRTAERLRGLCEKGPTPDRMRYYFHLMGRIEMYRKNYSQAVTHFTQAVDLLPPQVPPGWETNDHALFIDALAEAYYADENPIKALEEFEKARDLSSGRLSYGDLYARIYYKLGKIREEYGLHDIASDIYQKFLELWQDSDPLLQEKQDAEKRLRAVLGR